MFGAVAGASLDPGVPRDTQLCEEVQGHRADLGQQGQLSPGVLHHGLQPQADAEDWQLPRVHLIQQGAAVEIGRPSRARRQHDQIRRVGVEQ